MTLFLEYPVVFKILMAEGHICETNPSSRRVWRYAGYCPARQYSSMGHIILKQYRQLPINRIIHEIRPEQSVDKEGNVHFYYKLWSAGEKMFPRVTESVYYA